jgi:gamma-glutamyltranspeptidase/glutathione hydrolase
MRDFQVPGRSPVIARHAMAATSHPAATRAAVDMLRSGGNAVDAAITAAALLGVVEPAMTGIGGDCFALIKRPGSPPIALNGAGRAPGGLTLEALAARGVRSIEVTSAHAVTVPGAVDAWAQLLAAHGTRTFADVLAPAIEAAQEGFPVAPRVAWDWGRMASKLAIHAGARRHLLKDGRAPRAGEIMRFPALAESLRAIARDGRDAFYTGPIARDMVATLNALGGVHTESDFARQTSSWVTPLIVSYRSVDLVELPPSNQGIVAQMLLKIVEAVGAPAGGDPNAPERWHILLEAARLAYAARDIFVADPDMADVPVAHMLSPALIETLAARIDRKRRRADLGPIPTPAGTDTVYLSVVDKDGLAVSFINSLFAGFGSGIVTEASGITLHNRGTGFVLTPGHRNAPAPRKRPLHTLVPALALKDGETWLSFGVMGAAYQAMGHATALTNRLDYGLDAQEALDGPRIFFEDNAILAETGLPNATFDALAAMGHPVARRGEPWGGGQIVEIDHTNGVLIGASDPRKDGLALGY